MSKASALGNLAALLQEASAQGRVVMVLPHRRDVTPDEPPLVMACALRFALTRAEARMLWHLLQHGHAGGAELHAAMQSTGDPVQGKNVSVTVCRLRAKLKRYDVAIGTVWGVGFALGENARNKIQALLAERGAVMPAGVVDAPCE